MENFGVNKTPLGRSMNDPIPFDNDSSGAGISHAPLNLGGSGPAKPLKIETPAQTAGLTAKMPALNMSSAGRITGVKTFFTKLHGGAIEFHDEIVSKWLKENPGISIKLTNVVTGEIQGKKTEPNLILVVWY